MVVNCFRAQPIALKNAYTKIYTKNKVNDDVIKFCWYGHTKWCCHNTMVVVATNNTGGSTLVGYTMVRVRVRVYVRTRVRTYRGMHIFIN